MFIVNLALSDMIFSLVMGFPLLTISAFNKKWIWGNTGKSFCHVVKTYHTVLLQWGDR